MKKILIVLTILISVGVSAQQDPQISQFMFTQQSFNPGYAGSQDAINVTALHRAQWISFPGAPQTTVLNIDATVRPLNGGLGLALFTETIGAETALSTKFSYAYRTRMGSNGKVAFGIESGFMQKTLDPSKLVANDLSDPTVMNINNGTPPKDIVPDLGFGVYYNNEDLYFGLSAGHLLEGELDYSGTKLKLARHYYILAGYNYQLNNPDLILKPNVIVKSDAVETQFDINLTLDYKKMFWGGVTYRVQDAAVAMVGANWNNFKIGYSYDMTTSEIGNFSSGSHEIMLSYSYPLSKKDVSKIYRNVLFL